MKTTTVYLAATTSRREEMRERRTELQALGYEVTSRWLDRDIPGNYAECLNDDPLALAAWASEDAIDVSRAHTLISFTGGGGRGGRHVEFGIGSVTCRRLILCGPREHVFHALPEVQACPDWPSVLAALAAG